MDLRFLSAALLCYAALLVETTFGQSLSIAKKSATELLLQTGVPPATRQVLQASSNLQLWLDIDDDVSSRLSNRVDVAETKQLFFRLVPWTPPAPPIRIVLLGDSTVGVGAGWGTGIFGYFKPAARIVDLASANYSTRIFLASEQWPQMLAIKPEYVLMQFGWVDAGGCGGGGDPTRCMTTLQEYAANIRLIVQTIRGFNGIPILITAPDPKHFDASGKLVRNATLQKHNAVLKDLAAELQTHLIDLNALSAELLNSLGESASDYLSLSATDRVHFSPEGARVFSGLIVHALPASLGPYLLLNSGQPSTP